MRERIKYISVGLVILAVALSLYVYKTPSNNKNVNITSNPFASGVYATGIVESYQVNGSNINIYPEVSGKVTAITVKNGQILQQGGALLDIDDSVQRELVAKDQAQIQYAKASLRNAEQQYEKIHKSWKILAASVSQNDLDNSRNAVKMADENVNVAEAQYKSDAALLDKYHLKAPVDGKMLRVVPAIGDYVSPKGAYDTYTQTQIPVMLMETNTDYLQVRCFIDEILVPNLPDITHIAARLFVRGRKTDGIPLEFVNLQPFTVPNTQLSNERAERVDVRVLPIIFRFKKPTNMAIYPGQLVDILLKGQE